MRQQELSELSRQRMIEKIAKEVYALTNAIHMHEVSFVYIHGHLAQATYDGRGGRHSVEEFRRHMVIASAKCMMAAAISEEDVLTERHRQENMWGDAFDKKNTANDWHAYVTHYLWLALQDGQDHQENMLKAAALCQAAILMVDRYGAPARRHYDKD